MIRAKLHQISDSNVLRLLPALPKEIAVEEKMVAEGILPSSIFFSRDCLYNKDKSAAIKGKKKKP